MNTQAEVLESYLQYVNLHEQSIVITEAQMEQFLLEMPAMAKNVTGFVSWAEKKLKSTYNISAAPIRKLGQDQGKRLRQEFKKGSKPEDIGKKVSASVKSFMVKQGKAAVQQFDEMEMDEKIITSIMAFFIIVFVTGFLAGLLGPFVSMEVLLQITTVVIAPMVEEAAKTFFIQQGMPWVGTGVVFGIEAVMYIVQMIMGGGRVAVALILRLATLLMHFTTTYIQKKIIEKGGADESEAAFIAWAAGVAIHASWNIAALVFNPQVMKLIK